MADDLISATVLKTGAELIAWMFIGGLIGFVIHCAKSWLVVGEPGVRPLTDDGLGLLSSNGDTDAQSMWDVYSLGNLTASMGAAVSLIGFLRYATPAGAEMTQFLCSFIGGFGGEPPYCS